MPLLLSSCELVRRVFARALAANKPFGRKFFLDFVDAASIEDHLAMGNLPYSVAALESIGISPSKDQLGGGPALLLAPMNPEKVTLAMRNIAIDLNQFIGDVVARALISDQRV